MRRDGAGRAGFYRKAGIAADRVHVVGQIHSRTVVVAPGQPPDGLRSAAGEHFYPDADGLATNDPNLILGVTVADCMPLFVADPVTGARALLHSGWKGTGILRTAIELLRDAFNCEPRNLVVTMGPCISAASYQVDDARAAAFAGEWGPDSVRDIDGRAHLDLRAANEEICRRSGVDLVNIVNHCTVEDSRFASFRRQGPDDYTLMLALLGGTVELETPES